MYLYRSEFIRPLLSILFRNDLYSKFQVCCYYVCTTVGTYTYCMILPRVNAYGLCDWACKNQPCEHKKLPILLSSFYHSLITIYSNGTKSFLLM